MSAIENPIDISSPIDTAFEQRVTEFTLTMMAMNQRQDQANAEFLAKLGNLNLQQLNVLNIIGTLQPCPMTLVAENVLVSLSSVTIIVDKLVKMDLVQRQRSNKDRRVVYVSLSPKGKELFEAQIAHIRESGRKLLGLLTETEQVKFLEICQRFVNAMKSQN